MSGSGGAAVFVYATWATRFPELAPYVAEPLATLYWGEATDQLDPSPASRVRDVGQRTRILNLITAHIAKLNAPIGGQEASDLVGRISNASEGSVSAAAELDVPGSAAWYAQTRYGLQAWQALAPFRTMAYAPGPGAGYRRFIAGFPFGIGRRT